MTSRVICQLASERSEGRPLMEYIKVQGRADVLLNEYEVAINVHTCAFKRKRLSNIIKELLKDYQEDKAEGVGNIGIGTISHVGSAVNDINVGSSVVFMVPETSKHSGLAYSCIVPRYFCFEFQSSLDKTDVTVTVDALIPAYFALQNKASRGDTVLICDAHTPQGQIVIQTLHRKGCKIVVYLAQEFEKDILMPYRNMIDSFFEAWIHRSNSKQLGENLIKESEKLGFSLVICLQVANPLFPEGSKDENVLRKGTLPLSLAITILAAGGHLVLANDRQVVSRVMCQHLFAKGCSLHYINPTANLCSPSKLGSLLHYLITQIELLGTKELIPPQPIHKVSLEEAVKVLNNELDQMNGSYVVDLN